ncbi:MAG: hypothetical protein KDD62_03295, partial [Bdellovibrionales bacterium]|nr:hypothetical protein [Bdellovibrionales bacterium]
MPRFLRYCLCCFFCLANSVFAAPNDFDGDGVSDPSVVLNQSSLDWYSIFSGSEQSLTKSFGQLGNNLATGHYTGAKTSQPAHVNSSANWFILVGEDRVKIPSGSDQATYMAGADVDGDGKDDLMYYENACQRKKVVVHALLDPLNQTATTVSMTGGEGYNHSFYMDANGDTRDDFCWVTSRKRAGTWSQRFRVFCKDVLSDQRIAHFTLGKIYARPEPLKVPGAADMLMSYRSLKKKTLVQI